MFAISTPASQRMRDLLVPKADGATLRIVRQAGRFRLRVSRVRPGDQTFDCDGRVVLALDKATRESLAGRSLGVRSTATGQRLKLASR